MPGFKERGKYYRTTLARHYSMQIEPEIKTDIGMPN